MKRIILLILIAGFICISSTRAFSMTYLYASPSGTGPGTSMESPASLADVKTLAQSYVGTDNVTVYLRGGTYQVTSALNFGSADSGQNGPWQNHKPDLL